MRIHLEKFGNILSSRPAGKDAYAGFLPILSEIKSNEPVEVDFEGVRAFTPSWGDEFLSPLQQKFGDRIVMLNTKNPSVDMTIELLEETNHYKFRRQ